MFSSKNPNFPPDNFNNLSCKVDREQVGAESSAGLLPTAFSPQSILAALNQGRAVDLSQLPREQRLVVLNRFLLSQQLRPLEGLGDSSLGQIEWIGINQFRPDRFVARIDYQAKVGENVFNHLTFVNTNTAMQEGVIIIPVVSCKESGESFLLLVKEFRPVIGREVLGFCRGFPDPDDFMKSKPVVTALRELEEETGITAGNTNLNSVKKIAEIYENTGTHNVKNGVVEIRLSVDRDTIAKLKRYSHTEQIGTKAKTVLVGIADLVGCLEDQHSLSAFAKWQAINGSGS